MTAPLALRSTPVRCHVMCLGLALLCATALPAQAQPDWSVDPSTYNQTMTMIGTLYLNGLPSEPGDRVAAFIDGEVRGIAGEEHAQVTDGRRYYFMTIYAHTTGEPITFQAYDVSSNEVRPITETFVFTGNQQGSLDYPVIWSESATGCTFGDPTTWASEKAFEHSMILLGRPLIDGVASDDPNDRVAAFIGGEARGVTQPPILVNGAYIFFLSVGGNDHDEGEPVTFQVFDASENDVRDIEQTLPFQPSTSQGSPATPFAWTTRPSCDRTLLPVELVAFDAVTDGNAVVLRWETASETNNAGFEIQYFKFASAHLKNEWDVLAFVEGAGTTAEAQTYTYRVEDVGPGLHRFRLKQIDYDGTFAYSPEVEVALDVPGAYQLSAAYPNPFSKQTQVSVVVARSQRVQVAVYDVAGRRVALLLDEPMEAGQSRRIIFEGEGLPVGLYVIHILGETFQSTQRVVRLH